MANKKERGQKILYIITKAEPFGGAQKYVLDLASYFKKDADVSVAFGMGDGAFADALKKEKVPAIRINRLGRNIAFWHEPLVLFSLIGLLWRERPDVVHLNSSKVGGIGALATRIYNLLPKGNPLKPKNYKPKTNIVFTAHGWGFREDRPWWQRVLIIISSWLTILFSHRVIVLSERDKQAVSRWPFCGKKLKKIYIGVKSKTLASKKKARAAIEKTAGRKIPEDATWGGTIAELTKNKGLSYSIAAIAEIPKEYDIVYTIIGAGEEREKLEKEIADLGLEKRVLLLGTGFDGKASKYLRAFDIFLLPSVKEGLPYTLLEAGAARLPVISTPVGGIPEIITDMESGLLVRPKKPHEIAEAIRFFTDYPKKARAFGKELKARAGATFSQEEMLEKTKNLYGSL